MSHPRGLTTEVSVGQNQCVTPPQHSRYDDSEISIAAKLFHPFLALIASASEHELAKYLEYLKAERVILTLRSECLDKFIFFGKRHLDYIVSSLTDYCNLRRAHSSRDSLPPIRDLPEEVASLKMEQIEVKSCVGGLVTSFERKAA